VVVVPRTTEYCSCGGSLELSSTVDMVVGLLSRTTEYCGYGNSLTRMNSL